MSDLFKKQTDSVLSGSDLRIGGLGSLTTDQFNYLDELSGVGEDYLTNPEIYKSLQSGFSNLTPGSSAGGAFSFLGFDGKGGIGGLSAQDVGTTGTIFKGLGDLWGIKQGRDQMKVMKDYYGNQMNIQNEQAKMARDEYARLNKQRTANNATFNL